jgi:hypothetical protein
MCNAWNHSSGCNCGWGGGGGSGRTGFLGGDSLLSAQSNFDKLVRENSAEARTFKTKCWYCGHEVYYHTNGYGDCVLFDNLGYPWQVHYCWRTYCGSKGACENSSSAITPSGKLLVDFSLNKQKRIALQAALQYLASQKIPPTSGKVAKQLGLFFISEFTKVYQGLFDFDESNGDIRLVSDDPPPSPLQG